VLDHRVTLRDGGPGRVFAFAALRDRTLRGGAVTFVLAPEDLVSDDPRPIAGLAVDFGDGIGFRAIAPGEHVTVSYGTTGPRTLRLRLTRGGEVREAAATFDVEAVAVRAPDDTLAITGAPWAGVSATGQAYVYLAPGHATITDPVVIPEGFDFDNAMNADELYTLLNQEALAESLAARGLDVVILNFTEATDDLRRNAQVLVALLQQLEQANPGGTMAMVGPSMGGLLGRYALAWLETQGIGHRIRAFFSFDAPHGGANIPLGVQHWTDFFAARSADAAWLRDRLNTPGARQMLVVHFTVPQGTPAADPMRADWVAALASVGDWPAVPRLYGVTNGSSTGQNQGFAPGTKIVDYVYDTPLLKLVGNVWALPDQSSLRVFEGLERVFFITTASRNVTVSGTRPWDGAPGGWRATMAQMAAVDPGYGDIVALYPNHCFIPTVSALALATDDPFHDVAGDPDLLAHTPYDELYLPPGNEEHVTITAASAAWFLSRIGSGVVGVAPAITRTTAPRMAPPVPNPSRRGAALSVTLAVAGHAALEVVGVDGRRIARVFDGVLPAGAHAFRWDGRDGAGAPVPPGLYFARLSAPGGAVTRRIVHLGD
jgi:hypothetical protein